MKYFYLLFLFLSACSQNLLNEIANKNTNEAIYYQAKLDINAQDYASAVTLLDGLDPAFMADRERIPVYASAYAGRCGLNFLGLLTDIQNQGSSSLFQTLMIGFPGANLANNVADCFEAQNKLFSIGDQNVRDGDENLLMAFVSLAHIGTTLSAIADQDANATVDAGFDQCNATDFTDAQARAVGVSIATMITSLGAIGTSYIDGAISGVNSVCGVTVPYDLSAICTATSPSDFSPEQVRYIRYLIGSSDYGINSCGSDFATCAATHEPNCP